MNSTAPAPGPTPAPTRSTPAGRFVAQTKVELALTLRRGESLLLTFGIPVLLLVFFSKVDIIATGTPKRVDFLAPGILALAVMSTAMVGLGIATGFERSYGVLKRLGTTPLGRPALLAAKTASIVVVELLQLVILVPVALGLGWSGSGRWGLAAVAVVLGTAAFAGIGLTLAGTLRGEINLAAANGLYLVLLLIGGMVVPLSKLPGPMRAVVRVLPSGALSDVFHGALTHGSAIAGRAWIVLAVWSVAAPALAARTFRWE
jgi:ABC-2 type transport system permease protein